MNLSQRDRRAILLGAGLLALLLGYRFVLSPWLDSWSDARARIELAASQESALRAQVAQLRSQERMLGPIYGEAINAPLPTVEDARLSFVKVTEDLLKSSGLEVRGIRSQPMTDLRELPGVALVSLQANCVGRPNSIAQCLAKMGESEQVVLVQKLDVTPDGNGDKMSVSMVLATLARTTEATR